MKYTPDDVIKCVFIDTWKMRIKAAWWCLNGHVLSVSRIIAKEDFYNGEDIGSSCSLSD